MDSATCNVIYVDRNVLEDRSLGSESTELPESGELGDNLGLLLDAFGNVHVCASGPACISKLFHLQDTSMVGLKPTLVLIDTPYDEQMPEPSSPERDHSPFSEASQGGHLEEELYGLRLLERIVYETHLRSLSRLVVPIPVISFPLLRSPPANDGTNDDPPQPAYADYLSEMPGATGRSLTNRALLRKCLDAGAVDVMASPLHIKTLTTLEVHAYRAHKEAAREQQAAMEVRRGRKRSWVGVHEEQPYSYLREAMVSGLMRGICHSGEEAEDRIGNVKVNVPSDRRSQIARAIGRWHFSAHDFCDDSLLIAAILMFKHAFSMPELEKWRIPTEQLTTFLVATRAAYNTFVPYHNFRHAVDVLQATFNFLVHIGALPPYPFRPRSSAGSIKTCPLATLIRPFEALTLLVGAIGHDVGHPGVNNGFLTVLNAPLAQLYNDRSVLESFHCAAYSQILRRYWPKVFEDTKMRTLMISSILATDMGVHFDYMTKLENLEKELKKEPIENWSGKTIDKQTTLICCLIIKCADISNVARKYEAALQWMYILCDEFSRQATMENDIGIQSSLISRPKKDFLSLAQAQIKFMEIFAIPLFQGIADVLPTMQYTVDELETNRALFEKTVQEIPLMEEEHRRIFTEGVLSPRALGLAIQAEGVENFRIDPTKCDLLLGRAEMKKAGSSPTDQPYQIPDIRGGYKETNGIPFDNDPFSIADPENRVGHNGKQRCSETTDGSNSVPPGDWQSQATSATTGKMPLSPSTQGTSIVSQESIERPGSVPVAKVIATDYRTMGPMQSLESGNSEEDSNGNTLKPEIPLKKKPSRFRMNVSTFFRRNKGASSPSSGGS
ncbi:3',5'-cyclic-nucleotide phosphodiesterase regA [Daldinia loculata]|uniref:3',5'-cyclic-nucleotide phosphodiesterase regA n=1 Tax=Daldinia loculata TaxID=103429 RepID=UPI0020C3DA03|nr:3',5'-cyclic-nucleotide phosphodiesterase regA [Daldinia loculata]KAI1646147.1 3',5'-cyclic-nucleotide phosphodiesterase regA [Daldinia loculata]